MPHIIIIIVIAQFVRKRSPRQRILNRTWRPHPFQQQYKSPFLSYQQNRYNEILLNVMYIKFIKCISDVELFGNIQAKELL